MIQNQEIPPLERLFNGVVSLRHSLTTLYTSTFFLGASRVAAYFQQSKSVLMWSGRFCSIGYLSASLFATRSIYWLAQVPAAPQMEHAERAVRAMAIHQIFCFIAHRNDPLSLGLLTGSVLLTAGNYIATQALDPIACKVALAMKNLTP